jgi:hypothetical protein
MLSEYSVTLWRHRHIVAHGQTDEAAKEIDMNKLTEQVTDECRLHAKDPFLVLSHFIILLKKRFLKRGIQRG